MTKEKGFWGSLKKLSRSHYILYQDGKVGIASLCGCAHVDGTQDWETTFFDGPPKCARCLQALAKRETPLVEEPTTHASEISVKITVSKAVIPMVQIPVPDLEAVLELLNRLGPVVTDDPCTIARDTLDVTKVGLRRYIEEAKERDEKSATATWGHTGDKE